MLEKSNRYKKLSAINKWHIKFDEIKALYDDSVRNQIKYLYNIKKFTFEELKIDI